MALRRVDMLSNLKRTIFHSCLEEECNKTQVINILLINNSMILKDGKFKKFKGKVKYK
jgi:hypothetical protein